MEQTKYFTPTIEDIRVGYECEVYDSDDRDWAKHIVLNQPDLCNVTGLDLELRVPYLTKEQIEKEGWVERESYNSRIKNFEKDNYFLSFYEDDRVIILMARDVTKLDWLWLHQGDNFYHSQAHLFRMTFPCKDINTFRWICKLLNIN